ESLPSPGESIAEKLREFLLRDLPYLVSKTDFTKKNPARKLLQQCSESGLNSPQTSLARQIELDMLAGGVLDPDFWLSHAAGPAWLLSRFGDDQQRDRWEKSLEFAQKIGLVCPQNELIADDKGKGLQLSGKIPQLPYGNLADLLIAFPEIDGKCSALILPVNSRSAHFSREADCRTTVALKSVKITADQFLGNPGEGRGILRSLNLWRQFRRTAMLLGKLRLETNRQRLLFPDPQSAEARRSPREYRQFRHGMNLLPILIRLLHHQGRNLQDFRWTGSGEPASGKLEILENAFLQWHICDLLGINPSSSPIFPREKRGPGRHLSDEMRLFNSFIRAVLLEEFPLRHALEAFHFENPATETDSGDPLLNFIEVARRETCLLLKQGLTLFGKDLPYQPLWQPVLFDSMRYLYLLSGALLVFEDEDPGEVRHQNRYAIHHWGDRLFRANREGKRLLQDPSKNGENPDPLRKRWEELERQFPGSSLTSSGPSHD
ncbi:MAG TPA: hypothetical protein PKV71_09715, partial [Calditrichia bacterium]|nr:hypothetical protein [Calditrichia bacterium]